MSPVSNCIPRVKQSPFVIEHVRSYSPKVGNTIQGVPKPLGDPKGCTDSANHFLQAAAKYSLGTARPLSPRGRVRSQCETGSRLVTYRNGTQRRKFRVYVFCSYVCVPRYHTLCMDFPVYSDAGNP